MKASTNPTAAATVAQSPELLLREQTKSLRPRPAIRAVKDQKATPGGRWEMVFGLVLVVALVWGFWTRSTREWNPEVGLGYALGIAGLSCVGLLLIYPLRKRIPVLRAVGPVPFWFHTHMLLGALAPVLILFHSNFQLGSINSNIALMTMLIVASSGVIGRFLYVRIHRDMAGRKAVTRDILAHAELMRLSLAASFGGSEALIDEMHELELTLRHRPEHLSEAISQAGHAHRHSARLQRALRRTLKRAIAAVPRADKGRRRALRLQARTTRDLFETYRQTVNEAARLALYERFFALWHVLHLPLFFLMVMAAAIHVVAVHLY